MIPLVLFLFFKIGLAIYDLCVSRWIFVTSFLFLRRLLLGFWLGSYWVCILPCIIVYCLDSTIICKGCAAQFPLMIGLKNHRDTHCCALIPFLRFQGPLLSICLLVELQLLLGCLSFATLLHCLCYIPTSTGPRWFSAVVLGTPSIQGLALTASPPLNILSALTHSHPIPLSCSLKFHFCMHPPLECLTK